MTTTSDVLEELRSLATTPHRPGPRRRGVVVAVYRDGAGWLPASHPSAPSPSVLRRLARNGVSAIEIDQRGARSQHMIIELLA